VKLKSSGKRKIDISIENNRICTLRKMMLLQSAGELKTFGRTTLPTVFLTASSCSKDLLFQRLRISRGTVSLRCYHLVPTQQLNSKWQDLRVKHTCELSETGIDEHTFFLILVPESRYDCEESFSK